MSINRTSNKGRAGAVIGVAMLIAVPFIVAKENEVLTAYQDIVKAWTICSGETQEVEKRRCQNKGRMSGDNQ